MKLAEDPGQKLTSIYEEIELPTERVLFRMERTGTLIDTELLHRQSEALGEEIEKLEEKAWSEAGEKFNLGSPKQLSHILFEKLAIPAGKKTASGGYSTGEDVLSELALTYPLPKTILEYRALSKLKSTYTDKLPKMVFEGDGRVHTTFGQATAVTGRLASSDPNLQNIPVRTEEGRKVREAFIAPKGCKIISADYSQIELRIMAHISEDPGLISAFRHGMDVHRATASEVFGVAPDAVTPDQRRMAKVINFGLIYGMSAFGLAQNLGVSRGEAAGYIDQYFTRYPKVREYMEKPGSSPMNADTWKRLSGVASGFRISRAHAPRSGPARNVRPLTLRCRGRPLISSRWLWWRLRSGSKPPVLRAAWCCRCMMNSSSKCRRMRWRP